MRKRHLPFVLALLHVAVPLAAQGGASLPGRLEKHFHPVESIEGLTAAANQRLTATANEVAAIVASHPAVSAPPAGVCLGLGTYFPGGVDGPRASAEVNLGIAVIYDASGCSEMRNPGVKVVLNDAAGLLRSDGSVARDDGDEEGPIVIVPRVGTTRDGHDVVVLGVDRAVVLTRGGRPLLVPVTRERFLRWRIAFLERSSDEARSATIEGGDAYERWVREVKPEMLAAQEEALAAMRATSSPEEIARMRATYAQIMRDSEQAIRAMSASVPERESVRSSGVAAVESIVAGLRAELAALSPAQRAAPACQSDRPDRTLGACTGGNGYFSLDPDYFSPTLPREAVQVMVVRTPHARHSMESTQHAELRWRVFHELDHGRLAALLR